MVSRWQMLFGRGTGESQHRGASEAPEGAVKAGVPNPASSAPDAAKIAPTPYAPMEHLGEQNELLHVRFGYMADRLEDLKSLTEDFNLLTRPIAEMAVELPKAKSRILEFEALLHRETEDGRAAKEELKALRAQYSAVCEEKNSVVKRAGSVERALEQAEDEIAKLRTRHSELESLAEAFEKRSSLDKGNRERLESELSTISGELARNVESSHVLNSELSRQKDRADQIEREGARLQKIVDNQVLQIVEHQSRINDLDKVGIAHVQVIEELRRRLSAEQSEHHSALHKQELLGSSLSADKASLLLKVDELNARIASSDKTIGQLRIAVTERDSALHATEESLHASLKEAQTKERQVAVLGQQLEDRTNQWTELKRVYEETHKRAAMLSKALAAKSAALDGAVDQAQSRLEQVEELNQRFESERASLGAANRRLIEELENERAERTLAQGALKIARESRASLQRQNEALKRANRAMRSAPQREEDESDSVEGLEEAGKKPDGIASDPYSRPEAPVSNVSHFPSKSKELSDTP